MTLSFSTEINGKPNAFIDKIWEGLIGVNKHVIHSYSEHYSEFHKKFKGTKNYKQWGVHNSPLQNGKFSPKLHTIRLGNRWKAGMLIHPVINNRTKDRFQFAPTFNCVSVQDIKIRWTKVKPNTLGAGPCGWCLEEATVLVGEHSMLTVSQMEKLAINDGFENIEDFFAYFNKDFTGQIIHWTDLKY